MVFETREGRTIPWPRLRVPLEALPGCLEEGLSPLSQTGHLQGWVKRVQKPHSLKDRP